MIRIPLILVMAVLVSACQTSVVNENETEINDQNKTIKSELVSIVDKLPEYALKYPFEQPLLDYAYDALEPIIDAKTMETHYSKHHKGYTRKANLAFEENNLQNESLIKVFTEINKYPDFVRNNAGGFYNHNLYWTFMTPGGSDFKGEIADAIKSEFQSKEQFMEQFEKAAATQFGSGWAWLVLKKNGKLAITQSSNQDNPLMPDAEVQGIPLLNIDVWEHAYYLEYQNKRKEYISNYWKVVNWETVNDRYLLAKNAIQ